MAVLHECYIKIAGASLQTILRAQSDAEAVAAHAGVIVVAATNFPESLDKALVRPGRFDWHVTVPNPDVRGRVQILEVHFRDVPRQDDVDLEVGRRPTKRVHPLALHI